MSLPLCPVHETTHAPVLCRTEEVWHPVVCVPKENTKHAVVRGTHNGVQGERPKRHLSDEARAIRASKNARNRGRSGEATRPPGSQRRGR